MTETSKQTLRRRQPTVDGAVAHSILAPLVAANHHDLIMFALCVSQIFGTVYPGESKGCGASIPAAPWRESLDLANELCGCTLKGGRPNFGREPVTLLVVLNRSIFGSTKCLLQQKPNGSASATRAVTSSNDTWALCEHPTRLAAFRAE